MKEKNKVAFVICWFGKLPAYFPVWVKTCTYNNTVDFLLVTDAQIDIELPDNVVHIPFNQIEFYNRVQQRIVKKPSLKHAYRLCDFRPMYGVILHEELSKYNYWGYCDIDVVWGNINKFLPYDELLKYDAVFNAGHFTLIKNTERINSLYKAEGALFDYKTVATHDAIFAFDETTGIQRIARNADIKVKFGVPYVDADSKYEQLRSRMDAVNPDNQVFYWENGSLYRAKYENNKLYYQELTYIHLQKRKLYIEDVLTSESFWIQPKGFSNKPYFGLPNQEDVLEKNPFMELDVQRNEEKAYKKRKIKELLKRNPFQIFVRLKQEEIGINAGDGKREELSWEEY